MPRRRSFPEHREPLFWGTGRGSLWDQSSLLISADPLSSYTITPVLTGEETVGGAAGEAAGNGTTCPVMQVVSRESRVIKSQICFSPYIMLKTLRQN